MAVDSKLAFSTVFEMMKNHSNLVGDFSVFLHQNQSVMLKSGLSRLDILHLAIVNLQQ